MAENKQQDPIDRLTAAYDRILQDVHDAIREAARGPMQGILEFADRPIVSSDVIGNPHSSIYDAEFTTVTAGKFVKTLNWYDNEWAYANRLCDLLTRLAAT